MRKTAEICGTQRSAWSFVDPHEQHFFCWCGETWNHVDRCVTHISTIFHMSIIFLLMRWDMGSCEAATRGLPSLAASTKKMMLMWWDMGSCGMKEVMKNFRRCLNWKKNLSTSREANFTVDFLALRKWKGIFIFFTFIRIVYVEWFFLKIFQCT